jgi:replicative DNA helicase
VERDVLGCCITDQKDLDIARGSLDLDCFSLDIHKKIWRRICGLFDVGKSVDRLTVHEELAAFGEDEQVGGRSYLADLDNDLPVIPHIEEYVDTLREASLRRRMMAVAQHLQNSAADETESAATVLDNFSKAVTDLSLSTSDSRRPISTREMIASEGVDALLGPRPFGTVPLSPWPELNEALHGLSGGQLIVLMAATSKGKTSMALQMATCAAAHGQTPIIWTMEMSTRSLFGRMVGQLSRVKNTYRELPPEQRAYQRDAIGTLNDCPVYFDRHSRTVSSFVASIRQVRSQFGVGFAVVDYLQRIPSGSRLNRAQEVSENSRLLKQAAMDLDIPFLVLSQVDRASVKGEGKIGIHSGKETGDIENDADVLLWIDAPELDRNQDTAVLLHVGKQREGPAGFSIPMRFRPGTQVFLENTE